MRKAGEFPDLDRALARLGSPPPWWRPLARREWRQMRALIEWEIAFRRSDPLWECHVKGAGDATS